jgi:O-methyltransferase
MKEVVTPLQRVFSKIAHKLNFLRESGTKLTSIDNDLLVRIKSERLTYLSDQRLASLLLTCRSIEDHGLPGIFLEAGCALGGSAILIAAAKKPERPFRMYDVFEMIPRPTVEDPQDVHERYKTIAEGKSHGIDGDEYYGYQANLDQIVERNLNNFGLSCEKQSIMMIKGLVQDTLRVEQTVAFAHIDVDWYEPVKTCLERIFPYLTIGGSIVVDDYYDWGGAKKATDECLRGVSGQFVLDDKAGSLKITRVGKPARMRTTPVG